jgi:Fur family transcriptional regulator, peroxide stress response regulator
MKIMEEIKERFKEKGINPSYHRLKIYENLVSRSDHPTVEMIYNDLNQSIPTLSKTTVYNTLKVFSSSGLALPISIDETEIRYDAKMSFHGHLHCVKCHNIVDVDIDPQVEELLMKTSEHSVEECHVYLKGVCKKCLQ